MTKEQTQADRWGGFAVEGTAATLLRLHGGDRTKSLEIVQTKVDAHVGNGLDFWTKVKRCLEAD